MPKCIGCSKDFAARGFKTHIKSCKAYRYKKIADILPKIPEPSTPLEVDPGEPGPSNVNQDPGEPAPLNGNDDPPVNQIEVKKTKLLA